MLDIFRVGDVHMKKSDVGVLALSAWTTQHHAKHPQDRATLRGKNKKAIVQMHRRRYMYVAQHVDMCPVHRSWWPTPPHCRNAMPIQTSKF